MVKSTTIVGALLAIVTAGFFCPALGGEMSVRELIQLHDSRPEGRNLAEFALVTQYSGMEWVNSYIGERPGGKVFCLPGNLEITGTQLYEILVGFVRNDDAYLERPYGGVLLFALVDKFPCLAVRTD